MEYYNDVNLAYLYGYIAGFILVFLVFGVIAYILLAIILSNTSKTNGFYEVAGLSWIPFVNIFVMFALGSKKPTMLEVKSEALKYTLIFFGLIILSLIPILGILASLASFVLMAYYYFRLFFRWTGDQGKAILFVVLTFITGGIFFYIFGLMSMNKQFVAL
nr:hypothetical protein [Lysinibacillus timonensis]